MCKEELRQKASEIVELMEQYYAYINYDDEDNDESEKLGWDGFEEKLYDRGYEIFTGATRWCVVCGDYVLKFPFSPNDNMYNVNEKKAYDFAVDEEMDEAFAWCDIVYEGKIDGDPISVLAMEWCDVDDNENSEIIYDYCYEQYKGAVSNPSRRDFEDSSWNWAWESGRSGCEEVKEYMDEVYGGIIYFLERHNIVDVHTGNVGISQRTHKMVFTDYASYNREVI